MTCRRVAVLIALVLAPAASALAQPLGTFRWQIQPYCNVFTVNVTQQGGIYTLDGTDDRCAAEQAASVVGIAFLNPNGTVGFGMTTVVPGGTPIHLDAAIDMSSLSGTWRDSAANNGAFVFTPGGGTGGSPRPVPGTVALAPGASGAWATHFGEMAYASGFFDSPGSAQTSVYVLRNITNDATETELFLDGVGQRLTVANGRAMAFEILVVGRTVGGDAAGYRMFGIINNSSGTTSMVGAGGSVFGETGGAAPWNAIAAADDANDALVIRVTGASTATVRWVCMVRTAEVAF